MTRKDSDRIAGVEPRDEAEPGLPSSESAESTETGFASTGRSLHVQVPDDGAARQGAGFDPTPYLRQLHVPGRGGGADYFDVKWRLLWLRKEHPDAEIVTELVQ